MFFQRLSVLLTVAPTSCAFFFSMFGTIASARFSLCFRMCSIPVALVFANCLVMLGIILSVVLPLVHDYIVPSPVLLSKRTFSSFLGLRPSGERLTRLE